MPKAKNKVHKVNRKKLPVVKGKEKATGNRWKKKAKK